MLIIIMLIVVISVFFVEDDFLNYFGKIDIDVKYWVKSIFGIELENDLKIKNKTILQFMSILLFVIIVAVKLFIKFFDDCD